MKKITVMPLGYRCDSLRPLLPETELFRKGNETGSCSTSVPGVVRRSGV